MITRSKIVVGIVAMVLLAVPAWATVHTVTVANFSFTPQNITISQGDTVVWNCTQGHHNVHELSSPAMFFSGNPSMAPWQYQFVFNVDPSEFNYQCDPHAPGMAGTVTVLPLSSIEMEHAYSAEGFSLAQNYPNPFNGQTNIQFSVPFETDVKLTLMNILGQQVGVLFSGRAQTGSHRIIFDAGDLTSGLYFYRMETPGAVLIRTMQFIR